MKKILLAPMLIMVLCLSGCWDYRELADVTVVTGIAVDKTQNNKYKLTVEGINAQELNNRTAAGYAPSIVYSLSGNSIAELTQKMNIGFSRNLIYSHMRILIISETAAREGITEFIDFLERDREIRDDFRLIISRRTSAAQILKTTYPFQKSSSLKLFKQMDSFRRNWGGNPSVQLNDVVNALTSPAVQPVMEAVTIQGKASKGPSVENMKKVTPDALVVLDSLGIFREGKLIGFLPLNDSRYYVWLRGKLDHTAFSIECRKQNNNFITLRAYNNKSKITGHLEDGKAAFKVKLQLEGFLDSNHCGKDLNKVETYKEYEKLAEKYIEKEMKLSINKVQKKYKIDVYGFGEYLYRNDYKNFKTVEHNWDNVFKNAKVEVDAKVKLRRTALRTKSFISETKAKH
ncbi:spore germination protein KC [Peribacillus deserti]|uniref:Spore germination protein KC n=1 Tax=Peribacillus deserti TaxID=673318 RepID=A0ABS2QGQ0_9BACI|nr:Ger(x)C family spore germination protein [Peribacillus deserti]MBM7691466.1 spore germination protein KC [Peribacillus deserti]